MAFDGASAALSNIVIEVFGRRQMFCRTVSFFCCNLFFFFYLLSDSFRGILVLCFCFARLATSAVTSFIIFASHGLV